ncbi:hypothetical protein K450DRAFT_229158 [Umbelopsis ramanniana AG]|uniref:Uncharacterized protein n=1 Tax=Umbelopsis ramanniana AG TaxID=1314678 RepID=A0AAD5EFT3_UMBRA|nr:uncharacterized protein K450DRAFT_229158 [Umbelopsis ramanniana AG]KAI8582131.1 hypothetical protein K450DRAFT_229158 [Umbelopsis ramanniana AG]
MYINTLFVLSLAAVGALAATSASEAATKTTSATPSHVSGVPIAITPAGLPDCTSTAARHACPGIAFMCPDSCPDVCYMSITNACCPGAGNIVCDKSQISNSTVSGASSSASMQPTAAVSSGMVSAMPSGSGFASAAPSAQASQQSGSDRMFETAAVLATGLGALTMVMTNL